MAQAFSSFDTYLAPFVKKDNLTYKEVKQCIQSFVYGCNISARWGCLPITTEVFTPNGWKHVDELKKGDLIFTWVDGVMRTAPLRHIIRHDNNYEVLHQYKGLNYVQTVTPDHRCLYEVGSKRGKYGIKQSMDIFDSISDLRMPTNIKEVQIPNTEEILTDDEIMFAAMYYADGTKKLDRGIEITKSVKRDDGTISKVLDALGIKYSIKNYKAPAGINRYLISQQHKEYIENLIGDKYHIDEKFLNLSPRQSKLFIETWAAFDGSVKGRISCQYDNEGIADALQIIMLRSGHLSHKWSRKKPTDKNATNYVYQEKRVSAVIAERTEIPYDGPVWCPNTEDGTAIYKDEDGNIFISGNCQAPFTNITLDWTVPNDLAELNCIVGGKECDFKYKDCEKEMAMVNKAFIEIMIEGDANGRGFQYPICRKVA